MPSPIKYAGGYRVNFRTGGRGSQTVRARFPASTYENPKQAAQEYIDRVLAAPTVETKSDLSDKIRAYLNHAEKIQQKSPRTLRGDIQRLRLFEKWAVERGVRSVARITTDTIREFQQYYYDNAPFTSRPQYRRKPNTPATWEKYRQIVSTFLGWCLDRSLIKLHPMARRAEFRVKVQKTVPRALTQEEISRLLEWFDAKDAALEFSYCGAFFRMLLYSGLRLSEARELEWRHVDLKAGVLRVAKSKNKDIRSVPIHPELDTWLERLPRKVYVFDSGNGTPLYAGVTWLKLLYAATEALGIPAVRLHDFRHTFGATLAMSGVPLPTIMRLMGHKHISSTLIYLHFTPEHLTDAIGKLNFSTPR